MARLLKFLLFFLLCLAVALVVNLPVQHLLAQAKVSRSVQLYGVDGRIFSGRVGEVAWQRVPLRNVEYRFVASCLLKLQLCYRVDYDRGGFRLGYDLLNGDSEVSQARLEYPVAEILTYVNQPLPVRPGGRAELHIDQLTMRDKSLAAASGKLVWRNLGVDDGDVQLDIGDYQVDFTGSPEQYAFEFSDLDASLDVTGDATIDADGRYQADVRLSAASGNIDSQVRSVLDLVAQRSSANQYRIEREGRVPPKIARQLFR